MSRSALRSGATSASSPVLMVMAFSYSAVFNSNPEPPAAFSGLANVLTAVARERWAASRDSLRPAAVFSEHAIRIGAGDVRTGPRGRILRIADKLQHIPMLDGFSFGVHLVDIDAGDTRVVGVIRQQIDEIHMGEHVVADGDDSVDDNVGTRVRRFHSG